MPGLDNLYLTIRNGDVIDSSNILNLDKALLRPGRFDRQIVVDIPDLRGREAILKIHTRKVRLAKDVDLFVIAKSTPGLTGADLENLVNESALLAARNNKKTISYCN